MTVATSLSSLLLLVLLPFLVPTALAFAPRFFVAHPSPSSSSTAAVVRMTTRYVISSDETQTVTADEEDESEEEVFRRQTKQLCEERNLPLEKVKNARDISSVPNSPIQPGRVFRMGRISDATGKDLELLEQLNLKTLVDLRSPTELKDDPTLMRDEVFDDYTNMVWMERKNRNDGGALKELKQDENPFCKTKKHFWNKNNHKDKKSGNSHDEHNNILHDDTVMWDPDCDDHLDNATPVSAVNYTGQRKERHFVSLMNEFKYVKGTVSKLRKRDITKAILKSPGALLSRRVRSSVKKPFLDEINDGGLPMLNELLLRFGAPGIKYVLELIADRNRHPIAFYCTAGKDRTGMIAAILLALCGVQADDIVEDYTLSANVYAEMNDHQAMVGALSQRNLDPKTFLGAPPGVMRDTLLAINENYGSVEGYLNWIGFGPEKQQQLKRALMDP